MAFPPLTYMRSFLFLLLLPICATCPAHLILLGLIILFILGEEYKSRSSTLCSFSTFLSPHPSSVQIISSAPCSQTPSLYVPPLMSESEKPQLIICWLSLRSPPILHLIHTACFVDLGFDSRPGSNSLRCEDPSNECWNIILNKATTSSSHLFSNSSYRLTLHDPIDWIYR
jgi:hypothetical protein